MVGANKFKHVKNVPKSLGAVEGLRFEDLGTDIVYNAKEYVYICPEIKETQDIIATINEEVDAIAKELSEVEEFTFDAPQSLMDWGFQGR